MNRFYLNLEAAIKLALSTGVISPSHMKALIKEAKKEGIQETKPLGWAPDGRGGSVTGFVATDKETHELKFDRNGLLCINLKNPRKNRSENE